MLSFGLSTSPWIFDQILNPVLAYYYLWRNKVMFHRRLADTRTRKPTRKHPGLCICVEAYGRTVHYKNDLSPSQACWPWHQLDVHRHTDSQHKRHFQICVFIVVYHGSWMWSTAFTQIIVLRVGVPTCMNKLHRSATLPRTNPNTHILAL